MTTGAIVIRHLWETMEDGKKYLFYPLVSKVSIWNPWLRCLCAHSGAGIMVMGASARATHFMVVRKQRGVQDKTQSEEVTPGTIFST